MIVRVYWNSRRKMYSVMDKKTRKVIDHVDGIWLRDAVFIVSEKGRDRVRRENRKNVHAYVEGRIDDSMDTNAIIAEPIYYDPYKHDHWTNYEGNKITNAELAILMTLRGKAIVRYMHGK